MDKLLPSQSETAEAPETDGQRRYAPATERNRAFILQVLRRVLRQNGTVLEIGSGTGQHVAYFAAELPQLTWQPSEADLTLLPSIDAWIRQAKIRNVLAPLHLDILASQALPRSVDALLAINVLHYAPWEVTPALFALAARLLPRGAPVVCYGPYRRGGQHTAPSNESFDGWLKQRDARFGVRDLEAVAEVAAAAGFALEEVIDMPANNFTLVLRHTGAAAGPEGHGTAQ